MSDSMCHQQIYNYVLDELIAEGRSLINTMKSKGPSMLPCGTPDNAGKHLDRPLLIETLEPYWTSII